jgi:hypothetical protein
MPKAFSLDCANDTGGDRRAMLSLVAPHGSVGLLFSFVRFSKRYPGQHHSSLASFSYWFGHKFLPIDDPVGCLSDGVRFDRPGAGMATRWTRPAGHTLAHFANQKAHEFGSFTAETSGDSDFDSCGVPNCPERRDCRIRTASADVYLSRLDRHVETHATICEHQIPRDR